MRQAATLELMALCTRLVAITSLWITLLPGGAQARDSAATTTDWTQGRTETRSRLIAGAGPRGVMAGVEIELAEGWKTYWRFPGDAGGVPPVFDTAKSTNVKNLQVLLPAPTRISEKGGDILGYKGSVTFPVTFEVLDTASPAHLSIKVDYGVCREICVPVEAELDLDVDLSTKAPLPTAAIASLEAVPRPAPDRRTDDPRLISTKIDLATPNPSITIEGQFPGGTQGVAAYVESPNGFYIPLPSKDVKITGADTAQFMINLTGAVEPAEIRGLTARVTLVSPRGASEATFKIE